MTPWIVGALLHVVAACATLGFHHPDEFFQVVAFADFKAGWITAADLPWEYAAQLRPWFVPGLLSVFGGIADPFVRHAAYRAACAALAFTASYAFWCAWRRRERPGAALDTRMAWALNLAWFVPYLHARTSSESVSASFALLAVAALYTYRAGWCGFFAGLAFEARFQTGFMGAGLALWIARYGERPARQLAKAAVGVVAALALGAAFDTWGYGVLTWPPVRYVTVNLIEGKAAAWGTQPASAYLRWIFQNSFPLGILFGLATLTAALRAPRHPITWMLVPFVAVHLVTGHKEFRFLFPAALVALPLVVDTWARHARCGFKTLLAVNGVVALILALVPPRPEFAFFERLYRDPALAGRTLYWRTGDPYRAHGGLTLAALKPPGLGVARLDPASIPDDAFAVVDASLDPEPLALPDGRRCPIVDSSISDAWRRHAARFRLRALRRLECPRKL